MGGFEDGVSKQKRPDPVVSVRLPRQVLEHITHLADATGRSRGVYLRLAVAKMLPLMEARYGNDVMAVEREREMDEINAAFGQIVASLADNPEDLGEDGFHGPSRGL